MLTPIEKYFKEYSMYVLMGIRPPGEDKEQGYIITISLSPHCGSYISGRWARGEQWLQMTGALHTRLLLWDCSSSEAENS